MSESPSLTSNAGPGNCPFTVMMLCFRHSRVTAASWTCMQHVIQIDHVLYAQNRWITSAAAVIMDE
jgi:hypothetical protein